MTSVTLDQEITEWLGETDGSRRSVKVNALLWVLKRYSESSGLGHAVTGVGNIEMKNELKTELSGIRDLLMVAIPRALQSHLSPSVKGNDGEESFDDKILSTFPHLQLLDSSGLTSSGDRQLKDDGMVSILVEYKVYQNTVPTREVQKFLKDLQLSSCSVGIFYSCTSGIARFPSQRITLQKEGGSVAVFIPNGGQDGTQLLTAIAWAEWWCNKATTSTTSQCGNNKAMCELAQQALEDSDTMYRSLEQISEQLTKQLTKLNEVRIKGVSDIRSKLVTLNTIGSSLA